MTGSESGFQLKGRGPEAYERYMVPIHCLTRAQDLIDRVNLEPGERVLDVACGTGIVSRYAARRVGTQGHVTGVELNPAMLDVAREVAAYVDQIEFQEGSALALPVSDATFDAVLCQAAIQFIPDRELAVREMYRVLTPGGRAALNVFRTPEYMPSFAHLITALEKHAGSDAAGNVYVTGVFQAIATFGPFSLTSGGSFDAFVAKYDGSGNVLWARSAGGEMIAAGNDIAIDATANILFTGHYQGTVDFGAFTLTSVGFFDVVVAKYDSSGNVLWARSAGGTSGDIGEGIAVDAAGDGYVVGQYEGPAQFGSFTLDAFGSQDIFVVKYDPNGNVVWARSAGGSGLDRGKGIAVDELGNSMVTGDFRATASFDSINVSSVGAADVFLARYDSEGGILWVQSGGGDSSDQGLGVAIDAAGNGNVAGSFLNSASFGSLTLSSAGFRDAFVVSYDAGGDLRWARSVGGEGEETAVAIAVDAIGNSVVTGLFEGQADFGAFTLTGAGDRDVFVAKYTHCGNGSIDPGEECDDGGESATCDSDCTVAECGDGTLNVTAGEECDLGLGCTDCLCDTDFEPTAPPSLDCQPTCGNGSVDPGEECDGIDDSACPGACLSDCTCGPFCGNGSVDPGEECDAGLRCTDCLCDADFEPTAPPSRDCRLICGNGSIDLGEECDGIDDSACPGACLSDCTCRPFCGDDTCDPSEDSCNCPDDCGVPPSNEALGSTCNDGQDNDCDGLTDSADPDCAVIPTVSAWGLVVMALLLLAGAKVYSRVSRARRFE